MPSSSNGSMDQPVLSDRRMKGWKVELWVNEVRELSICRGCIGGICFADGEEYDLDEESDVDEVASDASTDDASGSCDTHADSQDV